MPQQNIRTQQVEDLLDVLTQMPDPDDLFNFFCDLLTFKEMGDIAQRLEVAGMLNEGTSYTDIQNETGASATTISRVSKCLNYGTGGYSQALEILNGSTKTSTDGAAASGGSAIDAAAKTSAKTSAKTRTATSTAPTKTSTKTNKKKAD